MSFQFCDDIYTFANFTTDMINVIMSRQKAIKTNPRYLILQDCSRYWSTILRGGCKLQLTFCLRWKTKYFVALKFRVHLFEQSHLLMVGNSGCIRCSNKNRNSYQLQLAEYHRQIVLWKSGWLH